MADQPIKNKRHKIIGYLRTDFQGNQYVLDTGHQILAKYDPKKNKTFTPQHREIGPGNLLMTLLDFS